MSYRWDEPQPPAPPGRRRAMRLLVVAALALMTALIAIGVLSLLFTATLSAPAR